MNEPRSVFRRIARFSGYVMVIVYLGIGTMLIFFGQKFNGISQTARIAFGILLVLYGIFRGYRAVKSARNESDQ